MAFGDNGTRYDEACGRCRKITEICNDCGRCDRHCSCEQDALDRKEIDAMNQAHPGFLDALAKHQEQGAAEQD